MGGFGTNSQMYKINGTANINAIRVAAEQGHQFTFCFPQVIFYYFFLDKLLLIMWQSFKLIESIITNDFNFIWFGAQNLL